MDNCAEIYVWLKALRNLVVILVMVAGVGYSVYRWRVKKHQSGKSA